MDHYQRIVWHALIQNIYWMENVWMIVLLVISFLEVNVNVFFSSFLFRFCDWNLWNKKWKKVCSFPCSSCENESTNCLSCVESYSLNSTSCISNEECLLDGYIENGVCSGSSFFFFWPFNYSIKKRKELINK